MDIPVSELPLSFYNNTLPYNNLTPARTRTDLLASLDMGQVDVGCNNKIILVWAGGDTLTCEL